jgi:ribonuclease P protein component
MSRSGACGLPTVRSSRDIDAVFRDGRRAVTPLMSVFTLATPEGRGASGRVAFIAGKKLGNAPLRNRCKRVLRAVAREAGGPWPGRDVVMVARASLATAAHADVLRALGECLAKLGVSA